MPIQSLAVFCGSKTGKNSLYLQHAEQLGKLLAENNVTLIYGGGNVGIMAAIADAVMDHGGKVTGIIPKLLLPTPPGTLTNVTPDSEVPIIPNATSIQLLLRLPIKNESLLALRLVK